MLADGLACVAGGAPGSDLSYGVRDSCTINVVPWPKVLSSVMAPFINSTRCREIARPNPVPPKRRVVEASAWVNEVNRRAAVASSMPMPLSITRSSTQTCSASSEANSARTETLPE